MYYEINEIEKQTRKQTKNKLIYRLYDVQDLAFTYRSQSRIFLEWN